MKRIWIAATVGVLVVAGAAVYFLLSDLDAIVARAIERHGSAILGTRVRVGSVDISLRDGRGTVRDLRVANPSGFSSEDAVEVGELTLRIDAASVRGSPVLVPEIRVAAPAVRVEVDARGRSNVEVLRGHAASYSPGEAPPEEPDDGARRLRIGSLSVERGSLQVDLSAVGREPRSTALPPLSLRNLGGSSGALPGEIGKTVAVAFTRQIAQTAAREQVKGVVQKELGRLGESAAGAARGLLDRLGGSKQE